MKNVDYDNLESRGCNEVVVLMCTYLKLSKVLKNIVELGLIKMFIKV